MNYGLLLNSGVSLLIAISGGILTTYVLVRKRDPKVLFMSALFAAFWFCITMVYLLASARILAAFFGNYNIDRILYQIDNAFGGAMAIPTVLLALYMLTRNRIAGAVGASLVSVVWAVWVVIMTVKGVSGPTVSQWHTDWDQVSSAAKYIAIFGLYLPTVLAMFSMFFALFRVDSRMARYRLIMTAVSMILTATLIIIEFLTTKPLLGIWIRLGILVAVLVGVFGYFPPKGLNDRLESA
ncbi:hypothetical protein GF359_01615 [candidate division WOR-3 bacterium]|uniref:Uncharacterized protein n=1 Tax=candidate division WOR-3 bacterium TaxID=2052148 RepID=A0A9D5K9R8_UNCW3|nr:hypothetical protein [candidate division WOR-3 bacterium]MBD3363891.1 hypothetical protein [candidate division WOR-3 bacterium]